MWSKEPIERYEEINKMSNEEFTRRCVECNDCRCCKMALMKDLYSSTKCSCIRDMPLNRFEVEVEKCEAYIL